MNTKLRLLVDECVPRELADEIENSSGASSVEVISGHHPLANRGTPDPALVNYAKETERIIVTIEGRLDEKKYPICTHPGIIVISATKRHEIEKGKLVTRFMQSGDRAAAKHAVTKLRLSNSVRIVLDPEDPDKRRIKEIPIILA